MASSRTWRDWITGVYEGRRCQPGLAYKPEYFPAATSLAIAQAEANLKAQFPESLRSLLLETDGVMDMMSIDKGDWFESIWQIWKLSEIVEQNGKYHAATASQTFKRDFTNIVFFAGAGTDGILFAFPVTAGICGPSVLVWHPIMDELKEIAPSLEGFLHGWLTSTISV